MALFQYKAVQANGTVAEGQLEAPGRSEAFAQMASLGLRPVSLSEKTAAAGQPGLKLPLSFSGLSLKKSPKVSGRALENFTRLLSSLLAAGVPLSRALVILHKEASNPAARSKWKEIHDFVVDGMSLADAMAKSPETFPRVYTAMVQAGETGGFLDLVLAQIADFHAREKDLRSKVTAAMLYPCVLLFLALAVLVFLLTFFIPKFQTIFKGLGAALPLPTQIVLGASSVVRHYGFFVLAGVVVLFLLVRNWFASEKGRRVWEGLMLRAPIVGPLVAQFAMARFCRMLGTLLGAGVPLVKGLNVARKSIGNQILVDAVNQSIERVQQGGQLGASLAECKGLFPSSVVEMVAVAEESGKLDQELIRIANVTEGDLDRELKTAVAFAEPLLLFFIAGFIGTIFISMVLPIFTMQEYIK